MRLEFKAFSYTARHLRVVAPQRPVHVIAASATAVYILPKPMLYAHPATSCHRLSIELLDAVVHPARHKRQRHDARDVHLRAKDVHAQAKLFPNGLDVPQTFLVIGAGTTDPDLYLVLDEEGCNFAESADDALECGRDLI